MTNHWSWYIWKPQLAFIITNKPYVALICGRSSRITLSHSLRRHSLWNHTAFEAHDEVLIRNLLGEYRITLVPLQFHPSFLNVFLLFALLTFDPFLSHVSSRLGMIYLMAPIQSPLIKPVSSPESRLRSSSDPMWSTNTSLDSWSKLFFCPEHASTPTFTMNVLRATGFMWSVHICAYTVVISCFSTGCCFRDFLPCKARGWCQLLQLFSDM